MNNGGCVSACPHPQTHNVERIEQLSFVLMQSLNLHIENGTWVEVQRAHSVYVLSESLFVEPLDRLPPFHEGRVVRMRLELRQLVQVCVPAAPDALRDELG